ncbi:MAG: DUF2252 family protein [Acidimicrobiia bacterium]
MRAARRRALVARRVARAADRPDPIALLRGAPCTRVPELVPIRVGRMMVSPFTFLRQRGRGDDARPRVHPRGRGSVQLCGGAHVADFGVFATPSGIVFDVNDFDGTLQSLGVGREAPHRQHGHPRAAPSGWTSAHAMRSAHHRAVMPTTWRGWRGAGHSRVWYEQVDVDVVLDLAQARDYRGGDRGDDQQAATAPASTALQITEVIDGRRHIVDDPPDPARRARGGDRIR